MDPSSLQIPTGEELYNMLMREIEPELVTDQLPLLEARYANETPEQAKARAEQYQRAFAEYEKRLAEYVAQLQGRVRAYQSDARKSLEHEEREQEEGGLQALEKSIGDS